MSVHSLPHLHLPPLPPHLLKHLCPDKHEVIGFLGTALILATLFVWG